MGQLKTANRDMAYLGPGLYGRVGFSAKDMNTGTNLFKGKNSALSIGDVGVAATLGYEFSIGLQINATY